jgi:hypothetical protein
MAVHFTPLTSLSTSQGVYSVIYEFDDGALYGDNTNGFPSRNYMRNAATYNESDFKTKNRILLGGSEFDSFSSNASTSRGVLYGKV